MKYISAEQFLQVDKKVQDSIMQWWRPEKGDLFSWVRSCHANNTCNYSLQVMDEDCLSEYDSGNFDCTVYRKQYDDIYTPLLTTQQLIDYIEDKTNGYIEINHDMFGDRIRISILKNISKRANTPYPVEEYKNTLDTNDLLQALWIVAQRINK